uniref:Uncharacterized protein n=1 Tax=Sus scrofa TaxID=9823 RepID=A0A287AVR6_PIG
MDKLKKVLSGQDMEDRDSLSNVVEATSLSSGTRIKGFITCFAARIICPRWELLCSSADTHLSWCLGTSDCALLT